MTAYEASDLVNGAISKQMANQALFITVVSAYLVVAYAVGEKLTKYQVWFINFTFCLFILISLAGATSLNGLMFQYDSLRAELILGAEPIEPVANLAFWTVAGVRLLLVSGSLIFMWQARHPKTE